MFLRNTKSQLVCFSELQAPSPAKDLTFVCEDGIVRSHQALFSWISSFLRRFFLSKQVMEDSGKRKDEVSLVLPSVNCEAVRHVITILTTGEVILQREKTRRDISDLWGLLNIDRIDFTSLVLTQLETGLPEVIDLVNDEDDADVDLSPPLVKTETLDQDEKPLVSQDDNREKIGKNSEGEVQENTRKNHLEGKDHDKEAESTLNEAPKTKRRGRKPKSNVMKSDGKSDKENSTGNLHIIASNCLSSTGDIDNNPQISISKDKKSAKEESVCGFKQPHEQLQQLLPNINISKAPAQIHDNMTRRAPAPAPAPAPHPHISITKQVRVPTETPPLKKPQIKRATVVKEVRNELGENVRDVRLPLSENVNPEETNEETRTEDEKKETELTVSVKNPTHEDNVQSSSIVVEGFDGFNVEMK